MRLRSRDLFKTIHTEGGLLPADLLHRVADNDRSVGGLGPTDYHLGPNERLTEAITRSWTRLTAAWRDFDDARAKLPPNDPASGLTRDRWLHPLFDELGYGRLLQQPAVQIEDKAYSVFSQWQNTPIHLVGAGVSLDVRTHGVRGAAGQSPHSLVQELLNRSPQRLWGMVSNGLALRLLRDNVSLTRQAYVQFDLEAMFSAEVYSDFVLLWLICHQSRVEADKPQDCWLERWTKTAADTGTRALEALRQGVEQAIQTLGAGFLARPENRDLHAALQEGTLSGQDYYRTLLRLVYRLLFLFVAEDRGALLNPAGDPVAQQRYRDHYSTAQLRDLAASRRGGRHQDRYQQLKLIMSYLHEDGCEALALPALGSYLWEPAAIGPLATAQLANEDLFSALRSLATVQTDDKLTRNVDFRNLGAEELGSVYESLLELYPRINRDTSEFKLEAIAGSERKTTGSYYTPSSLISALLTTALDPVLDEAASEDNAEQAILELTVVDPACGSGHFLIAAANRIAKRLAAIRSDDPEPTPEQTRAALRDVVGHCIHGIDINPMAVELCKVSLWMEALEPGRPLSFLDHKIVLGNSLLGTTPELIAAGVPDDAFKPIVGDDKKWVAALRKRNRQERERSDWLSLEVDGGPIDADNRAVVGRARQIAGIDDNTLRGVREQQRRFKELLDSAELRRAKTAADTWCTAFIALKEPGAPVVTQEALARVLSGGESALTSDERTTVTATQHAYSFLHWHIAFPDILQRGGFSVVLGNPPWDRPKPEAAKYFAATHPEIAEAPTATARSRLLTALETEEPSAHTKWKQHERRVIGSVAFLVGSGLYPLTANGKFNLGSNFLELGLRLAAKRGFIGLLNISGIATDDSGKEFIAYVMESRRLVSLFDFENRDGLFAGVHRSYRFAAITLAGSDTGEPADFVFLAHGLQELNDPERHVQLSSDDIRLVNPISRTCPVFRDARQGNLVKGIYATANLAGPTAKVLFRWDVEPTFLFVMSDHSHLFSTARDLELGQELMVSEIQPVIGGRRFLPLYEAKMLNQFDHRWSSVTPDGAQIDFSDSQRNDPLRVAVPRYWMAARDAAVKLDPLPTDWLIAIREVTHAANERTVIAAIIPKCPVGHNAQVLSFRDTAPGAASLVTNLNSICLDFAARTKVGGSHLSSFILRQLPILARLLFQQRCPWSPGGTVEDWILPRALELTYTAVDLAPFATAVGYSGEPFPWSPGRRMLIRAELDAAMFRLYGIERDDVRYIMGTFPIVRRRDENRFGEYRTERLILERYDAMVGAETARTEYETPLDPPPGDARAAHLGSASLLVS